jgi:hypothetical protein
MIRDEMNCETSRTNFGERLFDRAPRAEVGQFIGHRPDFTQSCQQPALPAPGVMPLESASAIHKPPACVQICPGL